jgi:hypothetical protein
MDSDDLSKSEFNARKQMIELCWDIYQEYCNNIDDEFEDEEEFDEDHHSSIMHGVDNNQ